MHRGSWADGRRSVILGRANGCGVVQPDLGQTDQAGGATILVEEYHRLQRYYLEHSVDARKLLQTDRLENSDDLSTSQMAHQAAAMLIASMLLNSDEAMTHE